MRPKKFDRSLVHKAWWATMNFLADRDKTTTRTRRHDATVIKATVDRRKLILEHKGEDMMQDFFARQHDVVKAAGVNARKIERALTATEGDLLKTYSDMCLMAANSYGPWVLGHLDATMKAPDPFAEPMLSWLKTNAASRVQDINKTTRTAIQRLLALGSEAGDTIEEIARAIDGLFLEQIIPNRSMVIARTEIGNATNYASYQAVQASGAQMEKTWNSLGDAWVRDAHEAADGQTVEQDDDFEVGGEYLSWPGDISKGASPENVINCRCFLTWDDIGG